jgi:hypothetical protein
MKVPIKYGRWFRSMANEEMDFVNPHYCPVFQEEISADICYDCVMALSRIVKISAVPELQTVPDIEKAREICAACPYSDLG